MNIIKKEIFIEALIFGLLILSFFFTTPALCANQQIIPSFSVSEEYTDNFNRTKDNKDSEFTTRYSPGIAYSIIDKKYSLNFDYNPTYKDNVDNNEYDAWDHRALFAAEFQPSKNTQINISDNFNRSSNRSARTNAYGTHDTNSASASLSYQFGKKDRMSLSYTYAFDDYEEANQDEFKRHNPTAYFSYWLTPQWGIDLNGSYSKTDNEISLDDPETIRGDIRLLKNMDKNLDIYIKYAHSYTEKSSGDQMVLNPSVGFDWKPTEDSGIVLGGGMLFQDYEGQSGSDSEKFFIEFDIYKDFSFSQRNNLSITGSSSYNDIDETASSLGFTISYEAGLMHTYKLTKRLTSQLSGSYKLSEYDEPTINREDKSFRLGAGLVWAPLKWLTANLRYGFEDFTSDSSSREDYQENKVTFSISLRPSGPVRLDQSNDRQVLEDRLFN
ncbi:MAG: outer membrane beta-barrel protein [Pseudomonadota bacterium]